jgi:DNA invertase Pin-like site-specific DNA recombinase
VKVVGYVRVSTREQEEDGYSIPAQTELIEKFCKDRGYKLLNVFKDVESGGSQDRKGFLAMVEFVEKRRVDGVIAWRLDRLTRNFRDYVILDDLAAKLIFIAEPDITDSATGKLMMSIRVGLAKHFLDQLGENVSMALERKAREGQWPSVAPVGYLNNEGLIEPDPERAPLIRKLFEEYSTGNHTIDSIRKLAKDLGLRQPRSGKPLARSRFVSTSAKVKGLLQNPIFYGVFEWKGERYAGKHEPIISKELFDDVQLVIEQRSRGTRKRKHDFPFSGLVHCTCGRVLTAERQKGHLGRYEFTYYRCNDRKKCGGPFVREEKLAEMMGSAIKALEMDDEVYEIMRDALEESQAERKHFVQEQTLRLQSRYQTLQNSIDSAYEDRLRDVIDEQLFKRKSKAWREEMQEIEIELESLRKATESYHDEGLKLIELAQVAHVQYLAANTAKQAKMLKTVVSNLVFDGTSITATYRKPFDILAERPSNENWLPG